MFTPSAKIKRTISKILPFAFIWLLTGWVFLFIEQAMITDLNANQIQDATIVLSTKIIVFASFSVFGIGCLVGWIEVRFINKLFTKKSFPKKLIGKLLFYSILLFLLMFIFYQIAASIEMQQSVFSKAVFDRYLLFFFSITHLSTIVQLAFSLVLSLLYAEISENLGQNVLLNFFTGKYHQPKLEQRIFIFTDMKDSTAIAEQLGSVKYFEFLRTYYNDLSDAIVNNYGEVYQYIGDEIVISWKIKNKATYVKSIECFFAMKESLLGKKSRYLKKYGIFPTFKGGIHSGEITVGEIGALKKEIFFTGDVINTTARIQSLCSAYNIDLLVSKNIVNAIENNAAFEFSKIDESVLKGKVQPVKIYKLTEVGKQQVDN